MTKIEHAELDYKLMLAISRYGEAKMSEIKEYVPYRNTNEHRRLLRALHKLEDRGLVTSKRDAGEYDARGPSSPLAMPTYKLTETGRHVLNAQRQAKARTP